MADSHIKDGQFQSDKYPWCKPGFFPMKLTDKDAQDLLWIYAERTEDYRLGDDLRKMLRAAGFKPDRYPFMQYLY